MKKYGSCILVVITLVFAAFMVGLLIGRNMNHSSVSIHTASSNDRKENPTVAETSAPAVSGKININTASPETLDTLPGIGPTLALRIVEYRTTHGPFQNLVDLTNVEGIGTKTLTQILEMITLE